MTYFAKGNFPPPPTISTMSNPAWRASAPSYASAVWPSANRAIYYPFRITDTVLVTQLFCGNGTVAANNIDIGIFNADGRKIVSSGSTAQAGTSTLQLFNVTDTTLGKGMYYIGMAMDGVTGTTWRDAGFTVKQLQSLGVFQQATAFALPASATFATVASVYLPLMGLLLDPITTI